MTTGLRGLLAALVAAAFTSVMTPIAAAQSDAPTFMTLERTDGAFKGRIQSQTLDDDITGDAIEFIELGVNWTGLMGQAVESYTFLWESTGSYPISDGGRLTRDSLIEHPDLVKRFDDIKPLDINLRMDFDVFDDRDTTLQTPNHFTILQAAIRVTSKARDSHIARGTKLVKYTPHLQMQTSGRRSSNFIPSSPLRYRDFVDWNNTSNTPDLDAAAQNTMRAAKSIKISNLRIETLTWPMSSIDNIQRALELREKEEGDDTDDRSEDDDNEDSAESENTDDDFWSGNDDTSRSADDDFWSGGMAEDESDFWSGEGTIDQEIEVEKGMAEGTGHQFLGTQSVIGSYITVSYYDHSQEDGDRVRLFKNGETIENNIRLTNRTQSTRINLETGINRISFESLSQGSAGENTATFDIETSGGENVFSRKWNITDGFKATLLIVRQ